MNKKYCLVLAAIPKNDYYSAGWLAGSVIAHKIQSDICDKTFWVCPLKYVGIKNSEKQRIEAQGGLIHSLERYGYFYDGKDGAISWIFDLVAIYKNKELNDLYSKNKSDFDKYMGFRKIYFHDKGSGNYYWILIKNIRRLEKPFDKKEVGNSIYKIPSFQRYTLNKKRNIITHDFMQGGAVFACEYPKNNEVRVTHYNPATIMDAYLKELFLSKGGNKRLHESAIQLAFALKLMQEQKWSLVLEKHLHKRGRLDIMYRDGNDLVVVEIKRFDNDDPVAQLKRYIQALRRNKTISKQYRHIRGVILCGKNSKAIEAGAKKENFRVMEYSLSIDFKS